MTAAHAPIFWRYDLDQSTNPHLSERLGINATFNSGAMEFEGGVVLAVRVEGNDRKSFFAIAESPNGIDNFCFWDYPILMPETDNPDTNVYDMRLVKHEDGWILAVLHRAQRSQRTTGDLSAAVAQGGIARTRDLGNGNACRLQTRSTTTAQRCLAPGIRGTTNMLSTRVRRTILLTLVPAAVSLGSG